MTSSSSIDLPVEVIELILSKCPVKSAIRFKSVSKSWLSIISDPHFFRILQSKLSENQKSKFFIYAWWLPSKDLYLIRLEDGKFQREALEYPFGNSAIPLCSCDGLILLRRFQIFEEHILWNPLIRKHIIIPDFNPETRPHAFRNWPELGCNPRVLHLYFDSITNDYKIVFFFEKSYTIYSCKNGSWGEIKDILGDLDMTIYNVCVDGCIYDMRNGEIVFFDARDGKLHKFPPPNDVDSLVGVKVKAFSGRLCLYGFDDYDNKRLQLWVMEKKHGSSERCWRKLISMEKSLKKPYARNLRPLCLRNEDDVVLRGEYRYMQDKYFIYNSRKSSSFQEIDFDSTLKSIMSYHPGACFPYSENLYMPSSNIC